MPFDPSSASLDFDPTTAKPTADEAPRSGGTDAGGLVGKLYAAAHGLEDTATFGLGDKVAAGLVSVARGEPYSKSYGDIQRNAAAASEANPLTAAVGTAAGLIAGGGILGGAAKAAEALPLVGRGVAATNAALTLQKGQRLGNVAKVAATGAGIGAADAAVRGGDTDQIVNAGTAGAVLGPVAGYAGAKAVKMLAPAADRAMRLLADKLGENPDTLYSAFQNFKSATGHNPSMAELAGLRARGELRQVAADNPTIGEAASRAENAADIARPQQMTDKLESITGGPAQDENSLMSARKARMDTAMEPIRDNPVTLDETHLDMLNDPRVRKAVQDVPALRAKIASAREKLSGDYPMLADDLSVNDMDAVRKSLRGRQTAFSNPNSPNHNPHTAESYGDLADSFAQAASDQHHEYGEALAKYQSDSNYIRGFRHGMQGKTTGEANTPEMLRSLGTDEGREGYGAGFSARAIGQAGESESSARSAAQRMGESGFVTHAADAVGSDQAAQMQRLGRATSSAAENLRTISPGTPKPEAEPAGGLAHAASIATYHSPAGIMHGVANLVRFNKLKMAPAVQATVARMLFNPSTTEQGIRALRKAGADNQALHDLALHISGAAGAAVGNSQSGG